MFLFYNHSSYKCRSELCLRRSEGGHNCVERVRRQGQISGVYNTVTKKRTGCLRTVGAGICLFFKRSSPAVGLIYPVPLAPGYSVGRDGSVRIATCYGLYGPGIESRCGANFPPWGPPSLLYDRYQVCFQGVKWPGAWR